jgi:hypothetical protein
MRWQRTTQRCTTYMSLVIAQEQSAWVALHSWPRLASLDASDNGDISGSQCDALVPGMRRLMGLTQLAMPCTELTQCFVRALASLSGLQSLQLQDSWHHDLLPTVAQLPHLSRLDLKRDTPGDFEFNKFADLLAEALAVHGSIVWLDLSHRGDGTDFGGFNFATMLLLEYLALAGFSWDKGAIKATSGNGLPVPPDQGGAWPAIDPVHTHGLRGLAHLTRLTQFTVGGGDEEGNFMRDEAGALAAVDATLPRLCDLVIAGSGIEAWAEGMLAKGCEHACGLTSLSSATRLKSCRGVQGLQHV